MAVAPRAVEQEDERQLAHCRRDRRSRALRDRVGRCLPLERQETNSRPVLLRSRFPLAPHLVAPLEVCAIADEPIDSPIVDCARAAGRSRRRV